MQQGIILSIHIAPTEGAETTSVIEVNAVPGKGLQGDRKYMPAGYQDPSYSPDLEITLIEMEAIEALAREQDIELAPGKARRNLVTRGVALNHLVEKEFQVGEVRLKGLRLCEPCNHLASLTQHGVLTGLIHRGGLRAQILNAGIIRVGDTLKT